MQEKNQRCLNFLAIILPIVVGSTNAIAVDATGNSSGGARFHGGDEIILQGFHWNTVRTNNNAWYGVLSTKATDIANLGITTVWMPAPWRDWSTWGNPALGGRDGGGGEGYFWFDWNLNSQYGTAANLQSAAGALNGAGVKVIYDIVANHRGHPGYTGGGTTNWANIAANTTNPYPYTGPTWRNGGYDNGTAFMDGSADLNTENGTVYNDMLSAFNTLKNTYYAQGFRWDFVHGFPAAQVNAWMSSALPNGFCVGELWRDPISQDQLKNWSNPANCTVFDFVLKAKLNTGDAAQWKNGLNGNPTADWRERAVTFVDNHDTGYSPGTGNGQYHWPLPDGVWGASTYRDAAYAYILTSPGTPTVYWPDAFDWGRYNLIQQLIAIRKAAGVKAYSAITFPPGGYTGMAAVVQGTTKLVLSIGSNLANPNAVTTGNFTVAAQGAWGKIWQETAVIPPQRTLLFIKATTTSGQDMFLRGGVDESWAVGRGCTLANKLCAMGHTILNRLNNYTYNWETGDGYIDWYGIEAGQGAGAEGTPLEWTTNNVNHFDANVLDRNADGKTRYLDDGVGYYAANTFGANYWLYDATLDCANGVGVTGSDGLQYKLFEVKAYIKGGVGWESNRDVNNLTYGSVNIPVYNAASGNHFAVCGKVNVMEFGQNGDGAGSATQKVYNLPAQ